MFDQINEVLENRSGFMKLTYKHECTVLRTPLPSCFFCFRSLPHCALPPFVNCRLASVVWLVLSAIFALDILKKKEIIFF